MSSSLLRFITILIVGSTFLDASIIYNNGSSNLSDGADISDLMSADDFTLTTSASISQANLYVSTTLPAFSSQSIASVNWEIFADTSGTPGASIATGLNTTPVLQDTGQTVYGDEDYIMSFSLKDLLLMPGSYWLGLYTTLSSNDVTMYWDTTSETHGFQSLSNSYPVVQGGWYPTLSGDSGTDLAFSLTNNGVQSPAPEVSGLTAFGLLLMLGVASVTTRRAKSSLVGHIV